MSGSTSGNCGGRAHRAAPLSPLHNWPIRNETCSSICARAFVQVLQQKAVVAAARENLDYYDRVLAVSRDRLKVGDIAQVDLDRLELQRVQFRIRRADRTGQPAHC